MNTQYQLMNYVNYLVTILPLPAALPDLVMGSLIKNAGGTLAPGGGYVAGRADLVSAVGARLAAPGIGTDAGGVPGTTLRLLFQGEDEFQCVEPFVRMCNDAVSAFHFSCQLSVCSVLHRPFLGRRDCSA